MHALAVVVFAFAAAVLTRQQAIFRAHSDAVSVQVTVLAGSVPVGGLVAEDFALWDNGVLQKIGVTSVESLPVDVTLLVDSSGSMRDVIDAMKSSIDRITLALQPDDRVRLMVFADYVEEIAPFQKPNRGLQFESMPADGTELLDGLVHAMVSATPSGRRHLVLALTDGFGEGVVSAQAAVEIAKRFDGVLHIMRFETGGRPVSREGLKNRDRLLRQTTDVAEATGGSVHPAESPSRIVQTIERILDGFRRSYVLTYVPQSVVAHGWHTVQVRVTRPGSNRYTVRARNGYFIAR